LQKHVQKAPVTSFLNVFFNMTILTNIHKNTNSFARHTDVNLKHLIILMFSTNSVKMIIRFS